MIKRVPVIEADGSRVLRFAEQPTFDATKRGHEYRTPGYYVELTEEPTKQVYGRSYKKKYIVSWGDERGHLGSKEFDEITRAESEYERQLNHYDIVED